MRTEPTGRPGRFHEAGFYRSDAEFAALIVPFAEDGVAAGQPVILGYDKRKTSLLRSWLYDPGAVTFLAESSLYDTPARAIASYWQMFEDLTAAGATQIRIAGDVPHEGNGGRFAGWDRYESAANTVWDRFPVWSRCLYDATTAASRVLDIAARTHPRIVLPSGQYQPSRRYQPPADFQPLPPDPDPLEDSGPRHRDERSVTGPGSARAHQHRRGPRTRHGSGGTGDRGWRGRRQRPAAWRVPGDRADLGWIRADPGSRARLRPGASRPAGRADSRAGRAGTAGKRALAHPHDRSRRRADPVSGRLYRPALRRACCLITRQRLSPPPVTALLISQ